MDAADTKPDLGKLRAGRGSEATKDGVKDAGFRKGVVRRQGQEEEGARVIEVHFSGCRAPPTHPAGRESEWKIVLKRNVEETIRKVDNSAEPSVLGTSYHYSRRNEWTMKVKRWTNPNSLLSVILGVVRRTEPSWAIVGTEVVGWVGMIIRKVEDREVGMRADTRAREIAKANGWTLAPRAPHWAGQTKLRHVRGKGGATTEKGMRRLPLHDQWKTPCQGFRSV